MIHTRLSSTTTLSDDVRMPAYTRSRLQPGILHLGLGAFHRAHQAVYTDAALGAKFAPWGIEAVSLRSTATAHALAEQSGLYSVLARSGEGADIQLIGAIIATHAAREQPQVVLERLFDPAIRIVTLTVTEKAYGFNHERSGLDLNHPDIGADLADPEHPRGVIGHLVAGLAHRRAMMIEPFTVLCCDNLPGNGHLVARLVREFAAQRDPDLARWIAENVAFPATVVDRIVPAPTEQTRADAEALLGCRDEAAVETEPFMQWVIEERFPSGRPAWEAGGALFVADVAPYERMKLRLLNGAHSLIAYLGQNRGLTYVRDVMAIGEYRALVHTLMRAAAETLDPIPELDLEAYIQSLLARFSNQAIAHATRQIAMDGTQKLPQRLLQPALDARRAGKPAKIFARAIAEWMYYCCRQTDLNDPRADELHAAARQARRRASDKTGAFLALPGLFPNALRADHAWRASLEATFMELRAEMGEV